MPSSESTTAKNRYRTSYNTRFDGQKVGSNICPELVGRRLLADLRAGAEWFRGKLGRNPWLKREQGLLKSTFHAENSIHRPSEPVAPAKAYWLRVLEISCRKSPCAGHKLKVGVPASFPLKVAGLVSTEFARSSEYVLELLTTDYTTACFLHDFSLRSHVSVRTFVSLDCHQQFRKPHALNHTETSL
jgi:hypothetical protein